MQHIGLKKIIEYIKKNNIIKAPQKEYEIYKLVSSTTNELIRTALVQAGKQGLQYAVSQYGNLTGNSIGQRNINNVISRCRYYYIRC